MATVTVSPQFQVVIPKEIRESLKLKPGQTIQAFVQDKLIPVAPIQNLRGFARGIDTTVPREKDRY